MQVIKPVKTDLLQDTVITLITVVYNGEEFLEQAIQSVLNQNYPHVEYLIVDGRSTDGTLEIIKKYSSEISAWRSEPDRGIYDAMNKGISMASGDLIGVLNSDDLLHENVLSEIARIADRFPEYDYYYGSVSRMKKNGEIYEKAIPVEVERLKERKYRQIPYPHGGLYIRNRVFNTIGSYNLRYKINADYDLILRMLDREMKGYPLPFAISKYRDGGVSGGYTTFFERLELLENHGVPWFERNKTVAASVTKLFVSNMLKKAGISRSQIGRREIASDSRERRE